MNVRHMIWWQDRDNFGKYVLLYYMDGKNTEMDFVQTGLFAGDNV